MKAPTISEVRKMVRRANPDAADVQVTWTQRPRRITFPTGMVGYVGRVSIQADGYRPTETTVTRDPFGTSV